MPEDVARLRKKAQEKLTTFNQEYGLLKRIESDLKDFLNILLQYHPQQKKLTLYTQTKHKISDWIEELNDLEEEIDQERLKLKDRLQRLKQFRDVP